MSETKAIEMNHIQLRKTPNRLTDDEVIKILIEIYI